jgi:hypothetical protein
LTYCNFEDKLVAAVHGLKSIENRGKLVGIELDCIIVLAAIYYDLETSKECFEVFGASSGSSSRLLGGVSLPSTTAPIT